MINKTLSLNTKGAEVARKLLKSSEFRELTLNEKKQLIEIIQKVVFRQEEKIKEELIADFLKWNPNQD